MKIQNIGMQNFGACKQTDIVKKYPNSFYTMDKETKLDLLYDMLLEQKQDLATLSLNQQNIQQCNDNASMFILECIRNNEETGRKAVLLGRSFDNNRISIIG